MGSISFSFALRRYSMLSARTTNCIFASRDVVAKTPQSLANGCDPIRDQQLGREQAVRSVRQ
jgi:hypothetical protein